MYCSLFTALIAVGAFIKIPIPVVPFTLQFLFTTLAGLLLGSKMGAVSVIAYMVLGLVGLPIFSEGGGIWYVFKPSFGYIIGFCIGTYVTGLMAERMKEKTIPGYLAANFTGLMIVYAVGIHYGTSFGYPMSTVSAHVSVCPNHQNGRVTPFKTRGICAMQGAFGYELDLGKLTEQEMEEAREQIAMYNEHYELFQKGNYYRLTSPMENRDFTAWSYVLPDGSKADLSVVYTDLHANPKPLWVKWKGLARDGIYVLDGREYTGTALMQGGMVLPKPQCNYDSYIVFIENTAAKKTSRND